MPIVVVSASHLASLFGKALYYVFSRYALKYVLELGSVAGPVIQANGRLTFEDDLRSGGLLYFTTQ